MLTSDTCLTMARNPRVCATALTPPPWFSTKTKKRPGSARDAHFIFFRLRKPKKSSRWAGTGIRHHLCDWVAFPHSDQKHFCARRVFENVVGVSAPLDFIEARTAWIGARRGPRI